MRKSSKPLGVQFDPVSAQVLKPGRVSNSAGVLEITDVVHLNSVRIVTPRGLYVQERTNQDVGDSRFDVAIEVWNYGGCDRLTADMWFLHRGIRYNIKGPIRNTRTTWRSATTVYQCRAQNEPSAEEPD